MDNKRMVCGLAAAVMMLGGTALPAYAEAVSSGSAAVSAVGKIVSGDAFCYRTEANNEATILDLTENAIDGEGVVKIPETIDGFTVTAIGTSVADFFRENWKTIKVVDFPSTIVEITDDQGGYDDDIGIGYKNKKMLADPYDAMTFRYTVYKRNQAVTIKCTKGSPVEKYAIHNSVPYVYNNPKKTQLSRPIQRFSKTKCTAGYIKFGWFPVAGAGGYKIYRATETSAKIGKLKLIATVKGGDNTVYKDTAVSADYRYRYVIKAFKKVNGKTYTSKNSDWYLCLKPRTPIVKDTKEFGFAVKRVKNNSYFLTAVEIYDYDDKKWYPVVVRWVKDKSDGYRYFTPRRYIVIDPDTLECYGEDIDTAKKCKFRVRRSCCGQYSDYSKIIKWDPAKNK